MLHGYAFKVITLGAIWIAGYPQKAEAQTQNERLLKIKEMYKAYKLKSFPGISDLSPQELWQKMSDKERLVVVDVREPKERAVSVIPGSISKDHFLKNRQTYESHTVISYCTIGYRSGLFTKDLQAEGTKAFNLRGSLLQWTHASLPLITLEGKDTKTVHVYGPTWDLLADGYTAVY